MPTNGSQLQKDFAIMKNSFLRIGAMTNLDAKLQLSVHVKTILQLYGVPEVSDRSLLETVKFIIQNFSNLDARELKIAFDYAAIGQTEPEPIFFKNANNLQVWGAVLGAYVKQRTSIENEIKRKELAQKQEKLAAFRSSDAFRTKIHNNILNHVKDFFAKNKKVSDMPLFWTNYFIQEMKMFPPYVLDDLALIKQQYVELEKMTNLGIAEMKAWRKLSESEQLAQLELKATIFLEKEYVCQKLKNLVDAAEI